MSKINVLHVLSTDKFSGAEKVAGQICENINKANFKPYILCNGGQLFERYKKDGLDVISFNVNNISLSNLKAFCKLVKEKGITIIHAHGARASLFSLLCKGVFRSKYRIVSHVHESSGWLKTQNKVRWLDCLTRNKFAINLLCGKKVYDHYLRYGNYIDVSKVRVLSNCVDIVDTKPHSNTGVKEEYGISGEFIFGFVGRFSEPKGLIPFLQRLSDKKELLEQAKLILVGDGPDYDRLIKITEEKGLSQKVIFTGNREDVFNYLSVFDLFLLPSITEGLPMVVLEAMSAGKPVLAFDVGSISEVVKDGINGYLVKPGEYDVFFRYMDKLKEQKEHLTQLGEAGKELVTREFGIQEYMSRIEEIYSDLVYAK